MSFGAKALNPGNINVRLGVALGLEEQAEAEGDVEKRARCQNIYADYLAVFMSDKEWEDFEKLPGFSYGDDRADWQINKALSARKRFLLRIARDNNVFARGEVEVGDASSLDELIEEARP